MTQTYVHIAQIVLSLGLLNVWLLRFGKPTAYRGKDAKSMKEEFAVYGLPTLALYVVGGLKAICALMLIVGIWLPTVVAPAAAIICFLMIGALAMHFKVKDPVSRSVPAAAVFLLSLFVYLSSIGVVA